MKGDITKRIFLLLGLIIIVVITGFLMTGPELSLKENPSESKSYSGYYVFFRTLDLLHYEQNRGLNQPRGKKNIVILEDFVGADESRADESIKKILDGLDEGAVVLLSKPWLATSIEGLRLDEKSATFLQLPEDAKLLFTEGELDYYAKINYKNASQKTIKLIYPSDQFYLQNMYFAELSSAPELTKIIVEQFADGPVDVLELAIDLHNPAGKDLTKGIPDLWIVLVHLVIFGLAYIGFMGRRFGPIRRQRPKRDMGLYEHLEATGSYFKQTRPWAYAEELDNAWFAKELRKFPEAQGRPDIEALQHDQDPTTAAIKGRIKLRLKILKELKEGRMQ